MYQQVDSEGSTHVYFQEIMDHKCDETKLQDVVEKQQKGGSYKYCGKMDLLLGSPSRT